MRGQLYLDGVDVYVAYGVYVLLNGHRDLVSLSPFKELQSNNWMEYDGIDVDLTDPKLDTQEVVLDLASNNADLWGDFLVAVGDGAYHEWTFSGLGVTCRMRMLDVPRYESARDFVSCALKLSIDVPLVPEAEPFDDGAAAGVYQSGYRIDDIDLSRYGAWVLKGTEDSLKKAPEVKSRLVVGNRTIAGVEYDDAEVNEERQMTIYEAKDANIYILIKGFTPEEFWRKRNALLSSLVKPGGRSLYLKSRNEAFACFYKSFKCDDLLVDSMGIWCRATLTLTFTDYRPEDVGIFLSTEDGMYVVLEDDEDCFVDLKEIKE